MSHNELPTINDVIEIVRLAQASFLWPADVQITHVRIEEPSHPGTRATIYFGYPYLGAKMWDEAKAAEYSEAAANLRTTCAERGRHASLICAIYEFFDDEWTEIDPCT